jgi:hypothetical protein
MKKGGTKLFILCILNSKVHFLACGCFTLSPARGHRFVNMLEKKF